MILFIYCFCSVVIIFTVYISSLLSYLAIFKASAVSAASAIFVVNYTLILYYLFFLLLSLLLCLLLLLLFFLLITTIILIIVSLASQLVRFLLLKIVLHY